MARRREPRPGRVIPARGRCNRIGARRDVGLVLRAGGGGHFVQEAPRLADDLGTDGDWT